MAVDRALYLGMAGAKQAMMNIGVTTNNLANANTSGFRAALPVFSVRQVEGAGYPTRFYDVTEEIKPDFTPGHTMATNGELDASIKDSGFFAIQTKTGVEAYHRNGAFSRSADGFLIDSRGNYVLGQRGLINIPQAQRIHIGEDGTISVQVMGQQEKDLTVVDRIKLVNPAKENLLRGEDGLFYAANGENFELDPRVQLESGSIESSNVNVIQELVDLIQYSKQFELQVKTMEASDRNSQKANEIIAMQ